MASPTTFGQEFLNELQSEVNSTRHCLERIPMELRDYKPHEKSMALGYLALLVAEIPKWITYMIEKGDIDLATFDHDKPATTKELVDQFDKNIEGVTKALEKVTDEQLAKPFHLKIDGNVVYTSVQKDMIRENINHWVHHRGQLTVYMRLNDIPVPSIYGPSADERGF